MKTTLKPGDSVYRVIDHPDGGWYVASVKVKSASDRQIALEQPFPFHFGVRYKPGSLGVAFFATPESALRRFIASATTTIARSDVTIAEANKAIEWALLAIQHLEHLDDRTGGQG